jgi:hypothetical protein
MKQAAGASEPEVARFLDGRRMSHILDDITFERAADVPQPLQQTPGKLAASSGKHGKRNGQIGAISAKTEQAGQSRGSCCTSPANPQFGSLSARMGLAVCASGERQHTHSEFCEQHQQEVHQNYCAVQLTRQLDDNVDKTISTWQEGCRVETSPMQPHVSLAQSDARSAAALQAHVEEIEYTENLQGAEEQIIDDFINCLDVGF